MNRSDTLANAQRTYDNMSPPEDNDNTYTVAVCDLCGWEQDRDDDTDYEGEICPECNGMCDDFIAGVDEHEYLKYKTVEIDPYDDFDPPDDDDRTPENYDGR